MNDSLEFPAFFDGPLWPKQEGVFIRDNYRSLSNLSWSTNNVLSGEAISLIRRSRFPSLMIPLSLGGIGADLRQMANEQWRLAFCDGSLALALNMHLFMTGILGAEWERGELSLEERDRLRALLEIVIDPGILVSVASADPMIGGALTKAAVKAEQAGDGSLRVSGMKTFVSLADKATFICGTVALPEDRGEDQGALLLIHKRMKGVNIVRSWDGLGMANSETFNIQLDNVRVPEEMVLARDTMGRFSPIIVRGYTYFAVGLSAVYLGLAVSAIDEAIRIARCPDHRLVADAWRDLMQASLVLWEAAGRLTGCAGTSSDLVLTATLKNVVTSAALRIGERALLIAGGQGYCNQRISRCLRDLLAGPLHPIATNRVETMIGKFCTNQDIHEEQE
jgi:alkylation response protein AidB-like acyl-CoA dehydrogenase